MLAICLRKFEAIIHSGKSTYIKSKPCNNWSFNFFITFFFLIMLSGLQDLSSLTCPCPLQWKYGVLNIGLPGISLVFSISSSFKWSRLVLIQPSLVNQNERNYLAIEPPPKWHSLLWNVLKIITCLSQHHQKQYDQLIMQTPQQGSQHVTFCFMSQKHHSKLSAQVHRINVEKKKKAQTPHSIIYYFLATFYQRNYPFW